MKQASTIVKDINELFPAVDSDYPIAFEADGIIHISGESYAIDIYNEKTGEKLGKDCHWERPVIDYYGGNNHGYPWVHPVIEAYIEKIGCYYEWQNSACICILEK